jgi:hypothetical protein
MYMLINLVFIYGFLLFYVFTYLFFYLFICVFINLFIHLRVYYVFVPLFTFFIIRQFYLLAILEISLLASMRLVL